jgi:hypothetical protein
MSIKTSELIEILKDFPDADVCACSCAEELLITEGGIVVRRVDLRSAWRQRNEGPLG